MQATLQLKLHTDDSPILLETLKQYTACFNAVSGYGWSIFEQNGIRLHHATYQALRQEFPTLPAQLVVSARAKAAEALNSTRTLERNGKAVNCPTSNLCPIRYDARSYSVHLDEGKASLATINGRVIVHFSICDYYRQYVGWKTCSADLCYRDGAFYLHVVVQAPSPHVETNGVLGIDLGIVNLATDSEGNVYSGERINAYRRRVARSRRLLQGAGTKSAKRHLRRIARKASNFAKDTNHVISKAVVNTAVSVGKALSLEDLTDIRERGNSCSRELRRSLGQWAFQQLGTFIAYKAERSGLPVYYVDPRDTSKTCSACGYCDKANRRNQAQFLCLQCGFDVLADWNAAVNIGVRAERSTSLMFQAA